jgi:hypothetical protein
MTEEELENLTETKDIVSYYQKETDSEDSDVLTDEESFNLIDYEKDRSTLLREGYIFIRHTPYNRAKRKVMTAIYT